MLPAMAAKAETFLNTSLDWTALSRPLLAHPLAEFQPLITRIDPRQVEAMVEVSREAATDPNTR